MEGETTDVIIVSTALRLEGHRVRFESVSGTSGKASEGCGNADTLSGTVGKEEEDVVKWEPGEDDEALVKEEKDVDDDLESDLPDINDIINGTS